MMFETGQKLPNALILESHLQQIIDDCMPKKLNSKPDKKLLESVKNQLSSCYVCDRIKTDMQHFMATVFAEWIDNGHNNFDDENTIILCVELTDGLLLSHGTRYEF